MLFVSRNLYTTPEPKVYPAPLYNKVRRSQWARVELPYLGEIAKSSFSGSGSDQTKSAIGPSWGISAHYN